MEEEKERETSFFFFLLSVIYARTASRLGSVKGYAQIGLQSLSE